MVKNLTSFYKKRNGENEKNRQMNECVCVRILGSNGEEKRTHSFYFIPSDRSIDNTTLRIFTNCEEYLAKLR